MVQIMEVAIYFRDNIRQRIIPDKCPVMSEKDMEVFKSIMIKALMPFVGNPRDLKVYFIYQNLYQNETEKIQSEETV